MGTLSMGMKKIKEEKVTLKIRYDKDQETYTIETSKGMKYTFPGHCFYVGVASLTMSTFLSMGEKLDKSYDNYEISMTVKAGYK